MGIIIAIGREFGSGGHKIGEYIANRLSIPYYDNGVLNLEAVRVGQARQAEGNVLADPLGTPPDNSDLLFSLQKELILHIGEREQDAVIVGRCADFILREAGLPVLSLFIAAPMQQRIGRVMRTDHLDRDGAILLINQQDAERRAYYEKHTGKTWGSAESYDLYYDTSQEDIGAITTDVMLHYKKMKMAGGRASAEE